MTMTESKRSESIANLAAALAIAQGQITTAPKDKVAGVGKFRYTYSTLDDIWKACRKPLSDNGLSVIQIPTNDADGFYLETILVHSSGEWISGTMVLPVLAGRMSELQAMGSAITYARRYMLGAIVGVTTDDDDDDDGQTAAQAEKQQEVCQNGEMSLVKLLANLNKVERVRRFYANPEDIMGCRPKSAEPPAPDDTDGWRQLFVDARDYALEEVGRAIAEDKIPAETEEEEIPF